MPAMIRRPFHHRRGTDGDRRSLLHARHRAQPPDPAQGALAGRADRRRAGAHRGLRAPHQRLRDAHRRARAGRRKACRGRADAGRRRRRALRPARHHQGPDRDRRDPDRARLPCAEGSRAHAGRAGGEPAGGRRRHRPRQDRHVGVRLVGGEPQPAHRHHVEPLEGGLQHGRLLGRGGCRRRSRLRAAAPGLGRRRLDPHAGALQRHLRPQADLRAGAQLAGAEQRPGLPCRADDAHGGRRRADAAGDGGSSSVGPHQPGGRARRLSGAARRRHRGPPGRRQPRPRARQGRCGGGGAGAGRRRGVRGAGLHGGKPGAALRPRRAGDHPPALAQRLSRRTGPPTSTPTAPCSTISGTAWTPAWSPASARRTG